MNPRRRPSVEAPNVLAYVVAVSEAKERCWPAVQGLDYFDKLPCASCGHPHADALVPLIPACHPGAPVIVAYAAGCLYVACAACSKPLVAARVSA